MSETKVKKSIFKKWWFWVLAIIIAFAINGGGEEESTPQQTAAPASTTQTSSSETKEEPKTEENKEEPVKEEDTVKKYKSGTYMVGSEIEPGLYKSEGNVSYWARLSDFTGSFDDIITNGNPMNGSELVEINENDKGFETSGSGYWYKIDPTTYTGESLTSFSDGTYLVGKDIQPGTYKNTGSVNYWARLSGFSGDLNDILANGNPMDSTEIVKILPSDKGFTTSGGGTWNKVD